MQKIAVSFFVLAFALTNFIGISTAQATGAATLSLSPTNTSVKTGESFSLSVTVSLNGESLDTARVNLNWDASKLEAQAVDLGSLFPNLSPSNSINNTAGTLSYGAFKFGTPVTTPGTVATVTFRALKSGTATIAVGSESKLIADGSEKLNTASLGKSMITISGSDVISQEPATSGDVTVAPAPITKDTSVQPVENTEAAALKYFGALAGHLPSSGDDWAALKCMVNDWCKAATQDTGKEKQALAFYTAKYNGLPVTTMEWNVIHAIAYTKVFIQWETPAPTPEPEPVVTPEPKPVVVPEPVVVVPVAPVINTEAAALKYFGAFAGHLPSSGDDWAALKCMVNDGCKPAVQEVEKEKKALSLYTTKYSSLPKTSMEWNVIHAIAYTKVFIQWETPAPTPEPEPVVTPEPEPVVTEPATAETLTLEQQAIGWFGKLTGKLPSTDVDWVAVNYMVNGYTPTTQDVDAESAAVSTFTKTFGHLPSTTQGWNVIAAIAYSGAF